MDLSVLLFLETMVSFSSCIGPYQITCVIFQGDIFLFLVSIIFQGDICICYFSSSHFFLMPMRLINDKIVFFSDWFDGLQTFMRYICHRNWLGGWLMPQKKSYFALQLPKRWWVFGLDLALHGDIDVYQFKFFSELITKKVNILPVIYCLFISMKL